MLLAPGQQAKLEQLYRQHSSPSGEASQSQLLTGFESLMVVATPNPKPMYV